MLKLFEVKGFKNFKNTITLDFSKVRDYKFNPECISNGLLGKTIVYGKNSVGKTNLGLAMFDIVSHLTSNQIDNDLYDNYMSMHSSIWPWNVKFRYVFSFGNETIDYSYDKNGSRELQYERIKLNGKLLYEYNYLGKSGNLDALKELDPTLDLSKRGEDCILKFLVNNRLLPDTHPLWKMIQFVSKMLWFVGSNPNTFIGYKIQNKDYYDFIFENNNLREFEDLLHKTGEKGNLSSAIDNTGKKRLYLNLEVPSDKGIYSYAEGVEGALPFFSVASRGTKALYNFFYWYKKATDISLMFIDEFDAFYHYELSKTIVEILKKMGNTQEILTTHNTNLLSTKIMRPDCFFNLTERGLNSFANATNRELREGHNLEKLYMSGEFDGRQ